MAVNATGIWHPMAKLTSYPQVEWTLYEVPEVWTFHELADGAWGHAVCEYVGDSSIRAMEVVYGYLLSDRADRYTVAQAAVVALEARGSILPSSVFERVARDAGKAGQLTMQFRNFMSRSYGHATAARMLAVAS